ncbi:DUF397 domain-containing protein [Nocardiopsis tropica]|uniref:DUF397 domain-containing protein n=1 Tax=Nocardiopsis tropica TaxID=109330 RepID=A0ABU7L1P2_9ACTN|nr:DUF397 domain-containing protein [Nocardiopsis umidischolae]MEE2054807.1 DUF397 domain-containing protein [Nocardiopsis umidischolae]
MSFRKSSYSSGAHNCVEVASWETGAAVRDTQNRDQGTLTFDSAEWHAFLGSAKG